MNISEKKRETIYKYLNEKYTEAKQENLKEWEKAWIQMCTEQGRSFKFNPEDYSDEQWVVAGAENWEDTDKIIKYLTSKFNK